jgi:CSLREA domain-containing protein
MNPLRLVVGALVAFLLFPGAAAAQDFVVTKIADTNDGTCNADCSLREAIVAANNATGFDRVIVRAGTYTTTIPGSSDDNGFAGDLDVKRSFAIVGAGARSTIIRDGVGDRVFDIEFNTGDAGTISGVTIRDGGDPVPANGVSSGAGILAFDGTLTLNDVAVLGNIADGPGDGAGIAGTLGTLILNRVTVAGNQALATGSATGATGGGISVSSNETTQINNSTISGNRAAPGTSSAGQGGGIYALGTMTFASATIAGNDTGTTGLGQGAGIYRNGTLSFRNTIVAGNTVAGVVSNCFAAGGSVTSTYDLEDSNSCGFTGAGDHQNTNPLLGALAANGGQTDTRAIPANSPAVDAGTLAGCPATDQRGVVRPQLATCDIGAFEFPDLVAPATTLLSGPPARTTDDTPTFGFSSSEAGGFLCRVDAGAAFACTSPVTLSHLRAGRHTFSVSAVDRMGNADPTPLTVTFSIVLPPAILGRSFNAEPLSGKVYVSVPAKAARAAISVPGLKGRSFVPLQEARQLPVGSLVDTRKGRIRLTSARDGAGKQQSGDFSAGVFQVLQSRRKSARGLTELRLKGASFKRCRARRSDATAARSRRRIRRLRSNAHGRFRTRGRYSAATVRGTKWDTTDRCDGTLTKVTRGKVVVRDFRKRRNVRLRAGKSYLARAR